VGLVLGFLQGGAAALGVDGGGGDRRRREREGVLARLATGYSSPSMPTEYDKGEKFRPDPMVTEREIHCSSFSFSLLARGEERKREKSGLRSRVGIARIQI
jgi:hypothetical protein